MPTLWRRDVIDGKDQSFEGQERREEYGDELGGKQRNEDWKKITKTQVQVQYLGKYFDGIKYAVLTTQ